MRTIARTGKSALLSFAAIALFSGCSDPLAPFQPEVTNAADSFQLQATGVTKLSTTRTYTWTNTGTRATINHSTSTTGGVATLTVRDAAGAVVYTRSLSPSLNEPTTIGATGLWTVQLTTSGYSGTLNFRVQKL